jgi:Uma2 family endonuclease
MSLQRQDKPKISKSKKQDWTLEQYFDKEYKVEGRHEFHNGEIRAMAYTSDVHGKILSRLIFHLFACMEAKNCEVYGSDRMLFISECNKIYYPDLMIVCGEEEFKLHKRSMKATLNPSVLIEISSPSTEAEDRIDKWACYKTIKSLKQYIIVSHKKKSVETFNRLKDDDSKWINSEATNDDDIIEIGDCKISLKDIYNKVML